MKNAPAEAPAAAARAAHRTAPPRCRRERASASIQPTPTRRRTHAPRADPSDPPRRYLPPALTPTPAAHKTQSAFLAANAGDLRALARCLSLGVPVDGFY
jgi:hypothetical protein